MPTTEVSVPEALRQMLRGYQLSQAISVMARLGIPDLLKDGPRSTDELAQRTGTHPPSLYRLLRAVAAAGLLTEAPHRGFALTSPGAASERCPRLAPRNGGLLRHRGDLEALG